MERTVSVRNRFDVKVLQRRHDRANCFNKLVQQPDAKKQGSPGQKTVKNYENYKNFPSKVNRIQAAFATAPAIKRGRLFRQPLFGFEMSERVIPEL
jgi:hypothetical protein